MPEVADPDDHHGPVLLDADLGVLGDLVEEELCGHRVPYPGVEVLGELVFGLALGLQVVGLGHTRLSKLGIDRVATTLQLVGHGRLG